MFFFSKIDLLGVPATLNFFGNEKKKSNFGGLCSVVFLIFVAWSIYNSSLDLIYRTNPIITHSEINVENPREVNVSLNEFPIAFMIQGSTAFNNNSAFSDESLYTIQVNHLFIESVLQVDGSYKRITTRTKLPLEKCTKEYFGEYASSFKTWGFTGTYCISKNNLTEQLKFQGIYSSTTFHAINAWIKMCNPATSAVPCKSQAEIELAMSGSYLNIIYLDNMMNIQNYSHPTAKFSDMYSTIMNPKSYKELNVDVGLMQVSTDNGLIVEDIHTETTFKIKNSKEIVDLNPSLVKTLVYLYIQGSRTETYYTRSYKKIPTILAEVGSLSNAFLGIVLILISPYLRLKSREALMMEFFDITGRKQEVSKKLKPEKQTSRGGISKGVRIKTGQEDKELRNKRKPKDFRLATLTKTFTTEAVLPRDTFQTTPSERQEIPQAKMEVDLKPQFTSEEEVNNEILSPLSPIDVAGKSLFYTQDKSDKKRQSNQYSQFALNLKGSSATIGGGSSTRRLISESYRVTRMDGDKFEDKEFDQMMYKNEEVEEEDDIEKQLENIDNFKSEENELNGEIVEVEKVKIETPVSSKNYAKGEGAIKPQVKEKKDIEKGGQFDGKDSSKDKKKNENSAELRIWEYMLSFVYKPKGLRKKISTIQEGVKNIEERLDLNNILKKMYEVDKLIALLLDKDQLELFNNIPKPQLKKWEMSRLERQSTFDLNLSRKVSSMKTMRNEDYVQQSYEQVKQRANKSNIDKRLVEIFKDELF